MLHTAVPLPVYLSSGSCPRFPIKMTLFTPRAMITPPSLDGLVLPLAIPHESTDAPAPAVHRPGPSPQNPPGDASSFQWPRACPPCMSMMHTIKTHSRAKYNLT